MLKTLSVRNYALISELKVDFEPGLTTITGETGAGKSILMGALSLILGHRADTGVLKDKKTKCIIEAFFQADEGLLSDLYLCNDLDIEEQVILRREINPAGKSRAFVNDTPVNLNVMKDFGDRLVNIHAQHENLMLNQENFPVLALDGFLKLDEERDLYSKLFRTYQDQKTICETARNDYEQKRRDQDYLEFQLNQLLEAKLEADKVSDLEDEREVLEHAGEIQKNLGQIVFAFQQDERSLLSEIKQAITSLRAVESYYTRLKDPIGRLDQAYVEIKDVIDELSGLADAVESDPDRLQIVLDRLDVFYSLIQKHMVQDQQELIALRDQLDKQLSDIDVSNAHLLAMEKELESLKKELMKKGALLSEKRQAGLVGFCSRVEDYLIELGMPNAKFRMDHQVVAEPKADGLDQMNLLFSANKNQTPEIVSKVASGGEISRLMLSIKGLITASLKVPTLIFDEIDAGVSGEIADRMGKLIRKIAEKRQVLNITHLPQVARSGDHHYLVYKYDDELTTHTAIKKLNQQERVEQLARMLSGEMITEEAISNAKKLLN